MAAPAAGASRAFGQAANRSGGARPGQLPAGNRTSKVWQGDHFTIGAVGGSGSVTGPGGITVGGARGAVAIKGPGGNTFVRGGGAVGVQGPLGNTAVAGRGAAFVNGQIVGGRTWSAVNGNFNHWNCFGPGWWGGYPGAWYPGKWAGTGVWAAATWATLAGWWGYGGDPCYYDYGGDVGYSDGEIYYGEEPVATEEQYYNEAQDVAALGAEEPAEDDEWLPLGVFGVVNEGQTNADKLVQLAVNKQGVIRGNWYDLLTDQVIPLEGAVDGKTQRAAFYAKSKPEIVIETGIYNLTNDEVPVLVHFSKDRTEQRTLVRMENPELPEEKPADKPAE